MVNEWIPGHLANERSRRGRGRTYDYAGGDWRPPWGPFILLFLTAVFCFAFLYWSRVGFPGWR